MTIKAEVIAASVSREGIELWTIALTYPRFIHAEFMTHRVFSRHASSSRAIPVAKSIKAVASNPAEPVEWGANQKGMQADEPLEGWRLGLTKFAWHGAKTAALGCAWLAMKAGAHKQVVNRILEPWSHITVLVSSTDWSNWDALRRHKDADPTIRPLAMAIYIAQARHRRNDRGGVVKLKPGEWHLPYVSDQERIQYTLEECKMMSVARSARVSYLTHDKQNPVPENDFALFDRLANHTPMHASPLEHQATPDTVYGHCVIDQFHSESLWSHPDQHGNFYGWRQNRKMLPNEAVNERKAS